MLVANNGQIKRFGLEQKAVAEQMVAEQVRRHSEFLMQAVDFLKNYMGQASQFENTRWMPTDVDELRIRDLLNHLQDQELEEAIQVATQESTYDDQAGAAQLVLGKLQHVWLGGITSGKCEHCPDVTNADRITTTAIWC